MSKWKDKAVSIVQFVISENSFIGILGLGDDGKVYQWSRSEGAWEKYWSEKDKPDA